MHLEAEIALKSAMHLEAVIERVGRCIWRPRWSNSQLHLEAEIKWNSEMHLEAEIKSNPDMHMETVIERLWRCIWRPRSCNSEMHLEAVIE